MKIHICLVSNQTLQNLIPVHIDKPDIVHLIVTQNMKTQRKDCLLSSSIQKLGIQIETHDVKDGILFSELSKEAENIALNIKNKYKNSVVEFWLNLTGGTKLMSIAFMQEFQKIFSKEMSYYYTDTDNSRIENLYDKTKNIPMSNNLNIKNYLDAQGFQIKQIKSDSVNWQKQVIQRKEMTKWLGNNAKSLQQFFSVINAFASKATKEIKMEYLLYSDPQGIWRVALEKLNQSRLIEWNNYYSKKIRFYDMDAVEYLNGFWLEEYAYLLAKETDAYEVKCGVDVLKDNAPNEFDLLVIHHNKLLVVECKTLQFGKNDVKEQDVLNKLDLLSQKIGGLFGQNILLSVQSLSDTAKKRVKSYKINLMEGEQVKNLGSEIKKRLKF